MKKFIRFYFLFSVITVAFSCSDDNDSGDTVDPNNEFIEYLNAPNSEGQLLSQIYIDNDNATTYVYGQTANDGSPLKIKSLAYKVENSNRIDYVVLDELQRVTYMYNEVNGEKGTEVVSFSYPEEGLVNCVLLNRDWVTGEETVISFTTVETDGEEYVANPLFSRTTNDSDLYQFVLANMGTAVGVLGATAVLLVGAAATAVSTPLAVAGALVVALTAVSANASDTPILNDPNPDAPATPVDTLGDNQCEDSNLEVIVGVDPGNLIVAIVNGDSADYEFYWSTGEMSTGLISDSIVAPEDGNYYVMVIDDNGCVAFGAATIGTDYETLIVGTWKAYSVLFNGEEIFDPSCYEELVFTATNFTAQDLGTCDEPQSGGGDYSITGDTLTVNFTEGNVSGSASQQILELTDTNFIVSEGGEYVYSYERVDVNIFGTWTVTATECDGTDDVYTGLLTLNSDFTVIQEDDSNGNYITNYFTFENNVLFIKTEYMDPTCNDTEFRFQSDTVILNYDSASDSFSGTGNTIKEGVDVPGCEIPPYNCNYDFTMSR